jgi:hypothetical protein
MQLGKPSTRKGAKFRGIEEGRKYFKWKYFSVQNNPYEIRTFKNTKNDKGIGETWLLV